MSMEPETISTSFQRRERYEELLVELKGLLTGESDLVANLANVAAAIRSKLGFFWVGFYRVENEELILGPFQGPVACTRIAKGKGVCGTAWAQNETIVVEDVEKFPGHIACSADSKSEIVLPIHNKAGAVSFILDVDHDVLAAFGPEDKTYFEKIVNLLEHELFS